MVVLICYDVSIVHEKGARRLRRVANVCKDYGQRVQNSVFECKVDPAQWAVLKCRLSKEIDEDADSLRFYFLGKNWEKKIEKMGRSTSYNPDSDSIIF
ncbi:MAG: CRISPR-associated endonuclease Cas2 [Saccharofermentanales bacterium]|jgi:CRISPR-associated protein Cas2